MLDFARGRMPAYVDTALNLVDVRDVAAGHLLAAERGRSASATSWATATSRCTSCSACSPRSPVSRRRACACRTGCRSASPRSTPASHRLLGGTPRVSLEAARMARHPMLLRRRQGGARARTAAEPDRGSARARRRLVPPGGLPVTERRHRFPGSVLVVAAMPEELAPVCRRCGARRRSRRRGVARALRRDGGAACLHRRRAATRDTRGGRAARRGAGRPGDRHRCRRRPDADVAGGRPAGRRAPAPPGRRLGDPRR